MAESIVPTLHEPSENDVLIAVPKRSGQYGITHEGGVQVLHDVTPAEDADGGTILVRPDHVARVLYVVPGARVVGAPADEEPRVKVGAGPGETPALAPAPPKPKAAARKAVKKAAAKPKAAAPKK
jgi:hypothetical protein